MTSTFIIKFDCLPILKHVSVLEYLVKTLFVFIASCVTFDYFFPLVILKIILKKSTQAKLASCETAALVNM